VGRRFESSLGSQIQEMIEFISFFFAAMFYVYILYSSKSAICLVTFPKIKQGEKVNVDAIKMTVEVKEIYIIKGTAHYIIYF
jgi:hypothetical protein